MGAEVVLRVRFKPIVTFIERKAMELLKNYHWEGNVRDLKATVEPLRRKSNGIISARDIPKRIRNNE